MPEATSSHNSRRNRTAEQVEQLRELADGNTLVGVMSIKLGSCVVDGVSEQALILPRPGRERKG
jgi:hypothetical protein